MYYLPNSIERCAPIIGFDPYAFIMDKESNLTPGAIAPMAPDSFETQGGNKTNKTNAEKPKKNGVAKIINVAKFTAAAVTAGAFAVCFKKCGNGIRKLFNLPQKQMPKALQTCVDFLKNKVYEPIKGAATGLIDKIIKKP